MFKNKADFEILKSFIRDAQEKGYADNIELFFADPKRFPKEIQDVYFSTIEKFGNAMKRKNAYKYIERILADNYDKKALSELNKLTLSQVTSLLKEKPELIKLVNSLKNKEVDINTVDEFTQACLLENDLAKNSFFLFMRGVSLNRNTLCDFLKVYFKIPINPDEKIRINGIPDPHSSGEIDAIAIVDRVLHIMIVSTFMSLNNVVFAPKDGKQIN